MEEQNKEAQTCEQTKVKLINRQLAKIRLEAPAVGKTEKNQQQGFNFRGIEGVYNAISGIMAKHEVVTSQEFLEDVVTSIKSSKGAAGVHVRQKIKFTFEAVDGSQYVTQAYGEAMDYGDKASNKALSIAHKYALVTTLCLPYSIDDPDIQSHDGHKSQQHPAQQQQQQKPAATGAKPVSDKDKPLKDEKAKLAATLMQQLGLKNKEERLNKCQTIMKKTASKLTLKEWDTFLDHLDKEIRRKTGEPAQQG